MTHPRISVSALSSVRWSFEEDLALWRELGVRWAGLLGAKLGDDGEARFTALAEAGIRASTVVVPRFDLSAPATWGATRETLRRWTDAVAKHDGWSMYLTLLDAAPHIALVQLTDVAIGTVRRPDDPPSGGRVPFGEGDLPLARILGDIKDTGYAGPLELELIGPLGDGEGYAPVIRRGVAAAEAMLGAAGMLEARQGASWPG